MRILVLFGIGLFTLLCCRLPMTTITCRFVGNKYTDTKNNSFLNNALLFVNQEEDTLRLNVKVPFDQKKALVINKGIFYNCHLRKDTVYVIRLKRICVKDIPNEFNSYYKTNVVYDKKDCSKFIEVEKNTEYRYYGNYEKYIDIDGVLYEIIGLSPNTGCFFPP